MTINNVLSKRHLQNLSTKIEISTIFFFVIPTISKYGFMMRLTDDILCVACILSFNFGCSLKYNPYSAGMTFLHLTTPTNTTIF